MLLFPLRTVVQEELQQRRITTLNRAHDRRFPVATLLVDVIAFLDQRIEAARKAVAVQIREVATLGPESEGKLVYFMTIDNARFRKPVVPGDSVHVEVVKQQSRGNVWKFAGKAIVDGTVVAEATYAAMILDK